jgi:N-acetylmuramoyl-L-alanine amidase
VLAPEPADSWIALDRWGREHGFGEPHRLSVAPVVTYALLTPGGVLMLNIASLTAFWDGLEVRLGFAPQLIDGQVFVHALDVRKNIEPLLAGFGGISTTNRVIVLDPGHGGANSGARSVLDGRWEKEFTLDWANRLAVALKRNGWTVRLTRTNDTDISLPDRVAFAEKLNADLFISLHFNAPGSTVSNPVGVETYCLTPQGMLSSFNHGYSDDVTALFPNNAFDAQNLQLAVRLHRALLQVNGGADRGVRRARFMGVLRGQNRPAALVEGGYLSNPREARLIADPAYRQKLAEAIANALK